MSFSFTDRSGAKIDDLAKSLYAYSLREAIVNICKKKGITETPKGKKVSELIEKLEEVGTTNTEKLSALYEAEADAPTRHIFLTNFQGTPKFAKCLTEKSYQIKVGDYPLHYRYLDFRYEHQGLINATFDHQWLYAFRKEISKENAKKKLWEESEEIRRHSVLVRFNLNKKYLSIGYSGFQNGGEKYLTGGVVYESLCRAIIAVMEEDFGIKIQPLNLRDVVKQITGRSTPKFSVDMLDSRYRELELFLRKGSGEKSIVEDISEALAFNLKTDVATVFGAFQSIITQSKVEEAELKWNGLGSKTIVRFLSIGPELRFSWDKKFLGVSSQVKVCDLLTELSTFVNDQGSQEFWQFLKKLDKGVAVDLVEIQQGTGLSSEKVKTAVIAATEMGLLAPVYKLNSDKQFNDYTNNWTDKITDLKKRFNAIDGTTIDGSRLSNILIGFKKIRIDGELK